MREKYDFHYRLIFLVVLNLFGITFLHAQSVISSSGGLVKNETYQLSQTVGETAVKTISNEEFALTQGVNQTKLLVTGIRNDMDINVTVFPNPTSKFLNLIMDVSLYPKITYQLFNSKGVLISKKKIENNLTTISFDDFPVGEYVIKISTDKNEIATYKIVKK